MTRAVIYTRVSLDRTGELLAVERQHQDCLDIVRRRGWNLVGEYSDNSISASKRQVTRPGYQALLDGFASGEFDALVCWDLDRLTRQPRQLEDWIDAATERGLKLVTANGEADLTTDAGRLFARIKAAVAREEIERKGARQKRAARQRVESGGMSSFKPAFGYTADNTIVPDEAAVVREMFERFASGDTVYGIRQWLNSSAHSPKQRQSWAFSTVRGMLSNRRYAGRVVYQGETVPVEGRWEAIVPGPLFDAVQNILSDPRRRTNRVGTSRKHLLSGIATCSVCGARVRGRSLAYFCPQNHVTKAHDATDALVQGVVRARLAQVVNFPSAPMTRSAEDAQVVEFRARLRSIEEDYDRGDIDGRRFAIATEKVQAQLADAERRLTIGVGAAALATITNSVDPVDAFDAATLSTRRAVIDALIEVVLVKRPTTGGGVFDPESVRITWKSPTDT